MYKRQGPCVAPPARWATRPPRRQVVEREARVPLYHFVTSVCAIIGGFFTLLSLLENTVHFSLETVAKKLS